MKLRMDTIGSAADLNKVNEMLSLVVIVANNLNGAHWNMAERLIEPLVDYGFVNKGVELILHPTHYSTPTTPADAVALIEWLASLVIQAVDGGEFGFVGRWLAAVEYYEADIRKGLGL